MEYNGYFQSQPKVNTFGKVPWNLNKHTEHESQEAAVEKEASTRQKADALTNKAL